MYKSILLRILVNVCLDMKLIMTQKKNNDSFQLQNIYRQSRSCELSVDIAYAFKV